MEKKNWLEELKDLENSGQEEKKQSKRKIRSRRPVEQFWKKPFFLGGLGLILLLFVLSLALTSGQDDQAGAEKLDAALARLNQMDNRIAALEEQIKDHEQEMLLMQSADSNFSTRLQEFGQELKNMQDQIQTVQQELEDLEAPEPREVAAPEQPEADADFIYHEVQSGENLFRIALEYNTSVENLRDLNDLEEGDALQPGQELKVGTRD